MDAGLTILGLSFSGTVDASSAATPATAGDEKLVPSDVLHLCSLVIEVMSNPKVVTSGLARPYPVCGLCCVIPLA